MHSSCAGSAAVGEAIAFRYNVSTSSPECEVDAGISSQSSSLQVVRNSPHGSNLRHTGRPCGKKGLLPLVTIKRGNTQSQQLLLQALESPGALKWTGPNVPNMTACSQFTNWRPQDIVSSYTKSRSRVIAILRRRYASTSDDAWTEGTLVRPELDLEAVRNPTGLRSFADTGRIESSSDPARQSVDLMGSDPFMTAIEAKTQTFLASTTVSRGSDPIKSTVDRRSNRSRFQCSVSRSSADPHL